MKSLIALVVILLSSSFSHTAENPLKAKEIEKAFVQIRDKISLGKFEVSNAEYKQFLAFLKNSGQENLYAKCQLDTSQFFRDSDDEALKKHYYSHSAFEAYPVVAVSYEAANEYCKWLTAQYNGDADRKYKKVLFRLPTEEEWTAAATGGNPNKMYPWDNFYLRDKNGKFLCNYRHVGDHAIYFDATTKTYKVREEMMAGISILPLCPVGDFPPSPLGLYNLSGNAAEMVAEKGLAKGGSYNDPGFDVTIGSKKQYQNPSTQIGFRVLMEVQEK